MKDKKLQKKLAQDKKYSTITELLKESGKGKEDQVLFIQRKKGDSLKVDYRRWKQDLLAVAGKLQKQNARHIGVVCDLTYDCILCLYATMVAGKVLIPIEADQSMESIEGCVNRTDIDLLLYHPDKIDGALTLAVTDRLKETMGCQMMEISEFLSLPAEPLTQWPSWEKDRSACIFITSGTEGKPHDVVLSQKNMAIFNSFVYPDLLDRNPRLLIFLPIHHVYSFTAITSCIYDGCEMHLSRSVKYVAQEIEEVKPDALITVPIVNALFRSRIEKGIKDSGMEEKIAGLIRLSNGLRKIGLDLRNPLFQKLRDSFHGIPQMFITAGSAESEDLIRYFDDIGIIVIQAYGMTETSGPVSANSLYDNRIGSVGHAHWFNEIRIKDSEIQIRGDNVMKEYYKNPEETEAAFDEGWFKTGDLGYYDKKGYLYITGRKKNLIILSSGENVSPEELEHALLESPYFTEVVVREKEGHIHAEIFCAEITAENEEDFRKGIKEAVDALNQKVPLYKRIVSWELRKEPFEKTASMKIRR